MSDIAIRVENLSKLYHIGRARQRHDTLRDALVGTFKRANVPTSDDTLWALRDVSFEVQRSEVVGVIGRNGAGKSTLLKILSRITEPTSGRAEIHGRVGSLLEVGTGFHPELTGRENIYLNGAILGMKRVEIDRKFDEIVAFAEIERFLDTPVKRYSSGMYVRLAFAVAAHLEPEILLVDEVLAVGDAAFQKKCLGKMGDVAKEGRTVLFVSHNMAAIQRLCTSGIVMDQGRLSAEGSALEAVEAYLQSITTTAYYWEQHCPPAAEAYFTKIYLSDRNGGEPLEYITTATPLAVIIEFTICSDLRDLQLSIDILDSNEQVLFVSTPLDATLTIPEMPGCHRAVMFFPNEILLAKAYGIRVNLWVTDLGIIDRVEELRFNVHPAMSLGYDTSNVRLGDLALRCNWQVVAGLPLS